jgi:hypothetical protein
MSGTPTHEAPALETRQLQEAENAVADYLRGLGFGQAAIEALIPLCLTRAQRRVGRSPAAIAELPRRAVEDAQRRIDRALAHLLELDVDDLPGLARARTALLLSKADFPKDHLLTGQAVPPEAAQALAAHLPRATPPEAPLPMAHQTFSFIWRR